MINLSMEPPEYSDAPECPVCGSTLYATIYRNDDGIVGCDDCISSIDAEDWWEELEEANEPDPDYAYEMRRDLELEARYEREHDKTD